MNIIKNSICNLAGYIIPSIVAIPALGYLARNLGPELFGIYTIIISMVSYIGIFDMGLTRAITREVAIYRKNIVERKKIISSATLFLLAFSITGSFLAFFFSSKIVHFLKISEVDFSDINNSFKLLALSIPIFLLNQLWIAILEGDEKFILINIKKSITSTLIVGMPAIFVFFDSSLFTAVIGLVTSRVISLLVTFILVRVEVIRSGMKINFSTIKRLVLFGGWITISNIISQSMIYLDRFIVSNMLGAHHIAYYSGPSEAISRLGVLPSALGSAIFPKFSSIRDINELKGNIIASWLLMITICMPVVVIGIIFAEKILDLWLGISYSTQSESILIILLIGFLFNALAQVPCAAIQSVGKAKITALLYCLEVIPYFTMFYILLQNLGLRGVAYAWSIRVIVDFFLLTCIISILMKRNMCFDVLKSKNT